jgi:hypothetical protein
LEAHAKVVSLLNEYMPKFADGNYHPALRYNAMLMLGELNSEEAVIFGEKKPAKPLIDTLPTLLASVTNPDQIDAVRVAALIGIRRHADVPLSAAARAQVIQRLLPLLEMAPPPGRTPEGHAWLQRQVIEILGALGEPGTGGAVTLQLRKMMVDAARPLSLRCAAAMALAQLPPNGDPKQLAGEMGAVAVEACRVDLTWLKDRIEQRQKELAEPVEPVRGRGRRPEAGGLEAAIGDLVGGGGGDDGEIVEAGDPVLNRCDELARRRLKARLICVQNALNALEPRAGAARAEVTGLASSLGDVMTVLENTGLAPENLQQQVLAAATKVETRVRSMRGSAPAAPAASGPAAGPAASEPATPPSTPPDVPEDIPF